MIEKTIKLKLFTIDELSEEARNKVVKDNAEINSYHGWWSLTYDDLVEEAKSLGFEIKKDRNDGKTPNIYFSLYSQGSGLCFEYTMNFDAILEHYVDKTGWSENKLNFVKKYAEFSLEGVHKGHYYHENSVYHRSTDSYYCDKPLFNARLCSLQNKIGAKIEIKFKELCRIYYNLIEEEDLYLSSEEAIIETIRANEYMFLANGKQINESEYE